MKPCWSCGTTTKDCKTTCQCAKCVDPVGYALWKLLHPDEYYAWLLRQMTPEQKPYTGKDKYGFDWERMDYDI